eukprot:CAMPEP_0119569826 /NCGR_PEP_ID=MMETSP1352-20130426/42734_1 /TAXON_ID=265584 /ORGANISM="Stauroneis constricta, Strain CCMP1120" /LENGTH=40 /DNA_ID= /DNA_START= /DNA_END= /DNA_ORIENTATION=
MPPSFRTAKDIFDFRTDVTSTNRANKHPVQCNNEQRRCLA